MATKIVTKNSSTASAVPTASDLVQGELAVNVADKRLFTEDNAGAIVELGTNPSGNVTFQDNGKAIFGAGDDLQIYHDGSNSYINDAGTGNLYLRASNAIIMQSADGAETIASFHDDNLCRLYFDNAIKLATTSTGIDVTGNVTMATGGSIVAGGVNDLILNAGESGTPDIYLQSGSSTKVKIEGSNGNVGINTSSPTHLLQISGGVSDGRMSFTNNARGNGQTDGMWVGVDNTQSYLLSRGAYPLNFYTNATERMRIDSSGNLLVGQSASTSPGSGNTTQGVAIRGAGDQRSFFSVSNEYVAAFNRNGTDGSIIEFNKDGASVGSIGVNAGSIAFGQSNTALGAFNTDRILFPATATGAVQDNQIDLGYANGRFKDLYLSGNALVGRTSSLSGQSGSVSANTVVSAHGGLSAHATSAGILEHYNDETILRSYGANAGSGELVFKTGGGGGSADSEAARIDSSGTLLIGTSDGSGAGLEISKVHGVRPSVINNVAGIFNRMSSDGPVAIFRKDGTTVGSIGTQGGDLYLGTDDANIKFFNSASIQPVNSVGGVRDNAIDIGASSARFIDIYATNGTIQTSDRNEKQDIEELSDAEQRVAVAAKGLLRKFRWKDSVAEKGDEARVHFGIIAQDLQAAFAAEGLDAGDYAMFISTTWTDEETNEEKTRMGVRYSELLAFIIAAL